MISRFLKLFIAIIVFLLVVTSLSLVDTSPRAYLDPWADKLWGGIGGQDVNVPPQDSGHKPGAENVPAANSGNMNSGHADSGKANSGGNAAGNANSGDSGLHIEEQADSKEAPVQGDSDVDTDADVDLAEGIRVKNGGKGKVIMGKLGNATAKAALGRATWKLLHTMTLRYPENPSQDERDALSAYFHLSSRLYPCGECAAEFQVLLKTYPPQTSSRKNAALWLCMIHNQVNTRLKKAEFDCSHLDDEYDCGCGDAPIGKEAEKEDPIDLEEDLGVLERGG